jgi:alpha-glucosidase (family GH31 glycosyl hydrolase)
MKANKKSMQKIGILLGCLCWGLILQAQSFEWTKVAEGVFRGRIGEPEKYDLLTASGAKPNYKALQVQGSPNIPFSLSLIQGKITDGKCYLRFPLEKQEEIFGFGLQFQTVHQRGKILQLQVDHYGGKDNGRTHAPTPFYVSSKGYGVFINSARYLTVYAGTGVRKDSPDAPEERDRNTDKNWSARPYSDAVEILVPSAGAEIYVFAGPAPMDAVKRYNLFQGGGVLPPRWGLGFTQRVKSLYTSAEVEAEAAAFAEKGFPLDFIGLEPGWQSASYPGTFQWDPIRYPDPKKFVSDMLGKGIRLNLWMNPYVSKKASFYPAIHPYTASHTVWLGEVPDFTLQPARKVFLDQLEKNQLSIGVSGYKIDEVDGYDYYLWPDVATFPSGHSAEQMRQTYGLLLQRYTNDLFHQHNKRTFGLVRASNGGGASFPYVIYNDYYKHEDFITALINSGTAGVLWTPEVRASKTSEEWIRRFQTVIFSPMAMINAWASGTKPWSFPDVADDIKELALLRMRMMPYWYSMFAQYHFLGTPPFFGMDLLPDFYQPKTSRKENTNLNDNPYAEAVSREIKDQYMAGENLLVAPLFAGQSSRTVVLPKGKWFDFYTGKLVGESEVITVSPGLSQIPVFVRNGGIIPMMPPLLHAPKAGEKTDLEIRFYGDQPGHFSLYDDDGETFAYEKGEYSFREITVQKNASGKWEGKISSPVSGKPNSIGAVTWKFMTQ